MKKFQAFWAVGFFAFVTLFLDHLHVDGATAILHRAWFEMRVFLEENKLLMFLDLFNDSWWQKFVAFRVLVQGLLALRIRT